MIHWLTRIQPGDGILICDCVGGTVVSEDCGNGTKSRKSTDDIQDLSSYVVKSLSPKLLMDQVCFSEGTCGQKAGPGRL